MLKRTTIAMACVVVLWCGFLALNPAQAAQRAAPAAPQNVRASVANGGITVQWDAVTGAASYDLYRGLSSNGETLYASGIVSNYFVNTKVTTSPTYYYEVTAVNGGGQSPRSAEAHATLATGGTSTSSSPSTAATVPSAPGLGQLALLAVLLLLAIGGLVMVGRFVLRQRQGSVDSTATGPLSTRLPDSPYAEERMVPPPPHSRSLPSSPSYRSSSRPRPEDDPDRIYGPPDPVPGWGLTNEMPALGAPFAGVPSVFSDEDATVIAGDESTGERHLLRARGPSGWIPAWPVEAPAPAADAATPRRTMWLLAGGLGAIGVAMLVVLAVVASSVLGNALGGSTPVVEHQPTATPVPPTATVVPTATVAPQQVAAALSCGGPGAGVYSADPKSDSGGFSALAGGTYRTSHPIDIGQVTDPAPQSVYQHERWGDNFSYTFQNLPQGNRFVVRLDFAELFSRSRASACSTCGSTISRCCRISTSSPPLADRLRRCRVPSPSRRWSGTCSSSPSAPATPTMPNATASKC